MTAYLTAEEELEFGRQARAGVQAAIDRLVLANLAFARSQARGFLGYRIGSLDDLEQEAFCGLIKAAQTYDPDQFGTRFKTHASYWIRHFLFQFVANHSSPVYVPRTIKNHRLFFRYGRVCRQLEAAGHQATDDRVAAELGIDPEILRGQLEARRRARSLDEPVAVDGNSMRTTLADMLVDPQAADAEGLAELESRRELLRRALEWLDPRDRRIIAARYLSRDSEMRTLEEVGKRMRLTRERIRQLEARALRNLQSFIEYEEAHGRNDSARGAGDAAAGERPGVGRRGGKGRPVRTRAG